MLIWFIGFLRLHIPGNKKSPGFICGSGLGPNCVLSPGVWVSTLVNQRIKSPGISGALTCVGHSSVTTWSSCHHLSFAASGWNPCFFFSLYWSKLNHPNQPTGWTGHQFGVGVNSHVIDFFLFFFFCPWCLAGALSILPQTVKTIPEVYGKKLKA